MSLLIINCTHRSEMPFPKDLPQDMGECFQDSFGGEQNRFTVWHVQEESDPPPGPYRGIIIGGSPAGVYEPEEWIGRLTRFVLDEIDKQTPLLGVCFGHQLIAQALGGKVEINSNGPELGTQEVHLTDQGKSDPLFDGLPESFSVMEIHSDVVCQLPQGAELLALNSHAHSQAFRLSEKIRAVQFHPEFTVPLVDYILRSRRNLYEDQGVALDPILNRLTSTPEAQRILRNFENHWIESQISPIKP